MSGLFAAEHFPVETNIFWQRDFIFIAPCGDINDDSNEDLIAIQEDYALQPQEQNLAACIATRALEARTFSNDDICGGQGKNLLWATFLRRDSLFLYDFTLSREIFITNGTDNHKPQGWNGYVKKVIISDINSDGKLEAVINVVTGFDIRPRGIFVLDWETGKLLWKFLSGPIIYTMSLKDIDHDGHQEILCGTHAVGNGNVANEMADWLSYVFILNSNGTLRWSRQIGHYSSVLYAFWLINSNADKISIVAIEQGSSAGERLSDSIFLIDAHTSQILHKARYGKYNQRPVVVNDSKNRPLIIIGGSDDTLRILDKNLKLVEKCFLNGYGVSDISVSDFTGQKDLEIAVATTNGKLLLYNLNLDLLSELELNYRAIYEISPVQYLGKSRALLQLVRTEQSKLTWLLLEYNVIPLLHRRIPVLTVIIGAILLLLLFSIGMIYARYTKTRDIRTVIKGLTGKSGVIEINHKGDITSITPKAREILNITDKTEALYKLSAVKQLTPILELARSMIADLKTQSPQETAVSLTQEQSYLVRCIRVKKGVLITFEDISAVEYMKRMSSWAPVAQKLAHGIKTPLMNIQLSAEQLESACEPVKDKTDKIIDGIKNEAKRLRKLTDNFMRFTQFSHLKLTLENINDVLHELCNKYSVTIPQSIQIECNFTSDLPKLMLDKQELENAIAIIVENAIEAMNISKEQKTKSTGKQNALCVKTFLSEKQEKDKIKKYITVEISDTGKGIPEKYLGELFKPYFTYGKPEGTGLGLPLAKKIVESHNGNIEINSKENIGTTVLIYLPIQ
jgi:nitrogen-specific signal transduction histidine kinase